MVAHRKSTQPVSHSAVRHQGQRTPRVASLRTARTYQTAAASPNGRKRLSMLQPDHHAPASRGGGSDEPSIASAAVNGRGDPEGAGGAVRVSATPVPAAPTRIAASSARTLQNRVRPPRSASLASRCRWRCPRPASTTTAASLSPSSAPYVDTIAPGEGSRSAAPRTPETVTRSSPHVARVEK